MINDFVIKIATVNGTGSASANTLLMKSVFRSGIPVMGKNYFPSNIQGLPTWYEIRVTKDGYVSRSGKIDVMVAMNAETYARDVREVASGGYLIYDSTWPRPALLARDDITVLGVPLARLCNENFNGGAHAHPHEEHLLRGRARRAARSRRGEDPRVARRNLREEAAAGRFEHEGHHAGLRLRQAEPGLPVAREGGAAGQDSRPHHDRRQHRR